MHDLGLKKNLNFNIALVCIIVPTYQGNWMCTGEASMLGTFLYEVCIDERNTRTQKVVDLVLILCLLFNMLFTSYLLGNLNVKNL